MCSTRALKFLMVAIIAFASLFAIYAIQDAETDDAVTITLNSSDVYYSGGGSYASGTVINFYDDIQEESGEVIEYIASVTSLTVPGSVRIDRIYVETGDIINSVTAVFTSSSTTTYTVTFKSSPTGYGTFTKGGSTITSITVASGTTYSLQGNNLRFSDGQTVVGVPKSATSQYFYSFDHWSSTSGTISANKTITGYFVRELAKYTVTFSAGSGGSVSTSTASRVPYGSTVSVSGTTITITSAENSSTKWTSTATANSGYQFSSWSKSSGTITGATTITASFSVIPTTVTMEASVGDGHGKVYIQNVTKGTTSSTGTSVSLSANIGDTVKFFAVPNTGYHLWYWWDAISETDQGDSNPYQITRVTGNEDLSANFEANQYTVTFNATTNGGTLSGSSTKTVTYGSTYGTLPSATKTGNTFTGWYTSASGGTKITSSSTVSITSNQTLYAQFSTQSYTVTFDATTNGGTLSGSSTKTVTYGSTYGTLPSATKTGNTFTGWYTSASGGTKITSSSTVSITSNQTLYAQFSAIPYTMSAYVSDSSWGTVYIKNVTRNTTSQTGTNVSLTAYVGDTVRFYATANTGYHFWYWWDSVSETDAGTSNPNQITVVGDADYSANFSANQYTVTFNATTNGGSLPAGTSTTKTVNYGSTYGTLPSATKTGNTFVGWFTQATGGTQITSSSTVSITSNQTLYAQFSAQSYTVTFDATTNGGTLSGSSTKTVNYGSTYGTLPSASKSGFTFTGWYTSASGGTQITSSSTVSITSNQTLYAQFSANSYTMSAYVSDSSWGTVYIKNVTRNTTSQTGTNVSLSAYTGDVVRFYATANTGYHFWYWWDSVSETDAGTSNPNVINVVGDADYSANFEANQYTITFDATMNGGTLSGSSTKTVNYGSTYGTLPSATKTGNTFVGWFTQATGGTQITSSSTVSITSNQTLYAQFSTQSYTVTFDATTNGGSLPTGTPNTKTVDYGSTYGTLPSATKTGSTFTGWYTSASGGTKITSSSTVSITSNQTLYAQFSTINHTAYVYRPINGTMTYNGTPIDFTTNPVEYTLAEGTRFTLVATPNTGYTFHEWAVHYQESEDFYYSQNQTLVWDLDGDVDITASFTPRTYTVTLDATTNGGSLPSGTPNTITVTYGSTYGTLPTASKLGNTFTGWYTSSSGGTQITSSSTVSITSNQTLYAQFSPGTYRIDAYVAETAKGTVYIENVTQGTSTQPGTNVSLSAYGGDTIRVYAVPSTGYSFWYWWDATSEVDVGTNNPYQITSVTDNEDLCANFTSPQYTVTFDATTNGGSLPSGTPNTKTVTYGDRYGTLPSATKTGSTFTGWFTQATGGTQITATSTVSITSNQTLYAQFIENSHTVYIYRPTNGTISYNGTIIEFTSQSVQYTLTDGTRFTLVATPSTGYTLNEWAVHYQESEDFYYSSNPTLVWDVDADVDITASFTADTYTVTLDATTNGGSLPSGTPNTITVTYGSTYGNLPTAHKSGNTFTGWYTSASGGTQITPSTTVDETAQGQTLYAQFMENSRTAYVYRPTNGTMTYNGTPIDFTTSPVQYTLAEGTRFTLVATPSTGYAFDEWAVHYQESEDFYYSSNPTLVWDLDGDVDITASFTAETYTVTLDATTNGGSLPSGTPNTITVTYGSTYGNLPSAFKAGNTFVGWFTQATGGTQVTSSTTVDESAEDQTLYAQFMENSRTAYVYRPINGTMTYNGTSIDFTTSPVQYTLAEGTRFTLVATPSTGYTFHEWAVHYQESEDFYYSSNPTLVWDLDGDVDITASFTPRTYTVTLDATTNGGSLPSGTPNTITVTYGSTYGNLPSAYKAGYSFDGWFTESTGGTQITASTQVTTADDDTIFAQFSEIVYTMDAYAPENGLVYIENVTKGTTSPLGVNATLTASYDDVVRFYAVPDDGYGFWYWWDATSETEAGDENPYEIHVVDNADMVANFEERTPNTVWWDNEYVNGSAEIVFNYGDTTNVLEHTMRIPLLSYDGIKKNGVGVDYFSPTQYTLLIELSFPRTTATFTLLSNGIPVNSPINNQTVTFGTWPQFSLVIDAQLGKVTFYGIGKTVAEDFSFMNYNTIYEKEAFDYSSITSNNAFNKIYHTDGNREGSHIHFQVMSTSTFLDTYGFVMIDPTLNIYLKFPEYNNLRLNLYSFALFGDTFTVNGHTFHMEGSVISDLYLKHNKDPIIDRQEHQRYMGRDPVTGEPIIETYYVEVIMGYHEYYSLSNPSDPDAENMRLTLQNVYVTWNNINTYDEENPRECYLTFVNDNITVLLGTFDPNSPMQSPQDPPNMTVSFGGMWYFTTAVWEPYADTETSFSMDWDSFFNLTADGFMLLFIGAVIAITVVLSMAFHWRLEMIDWAVVIGGCILTYVLLGVI